MKRSGALAAFLFLALASTAVAAFPGVNGRIAFERANGSGGFDLYTMNPDGSGQMRIVGAPDDGFDPAWSADCTRIAFAGASGEAIFVVNADGTGLVPLANGQCCFFGPAWSPDGSRIVFSLSGDVFGGFVPGTGGGPLPPQFTTTTRIERDPAWSPDGSRIAFSADSDESRTVFDIVTVAPDGTGLVNLTNTPATDELHADWSPDGSAIVFDTGNSRQDGAQIQVINADGSGRTFLARGVEPAWSPDGTKIAFIAASAQTGSRDVFVMNRDGSNLTNITDAPVPVTEGSPDWQPLLNQPPGCSNVSVTPSLLFPANRRFVSASLEGGTDPDGDAVTLSVHSVTQDEPLTANGDPTSPDATPGASPDKVNLRAERNPQGDGRIYNVEFIASDGRGGSCSGDVTVTVPRFTYQPAVDSAPPSYNSFSR
jgi:WD40 repeat protein